MISNASAAGDANDEDDISALPSFKRGMRSQNSAFQRLSSVIRRSLRLPTRSSQAYEEPRRQSKEYRGWRCPPTKDNAQFFTENSRIYISSSPLPPRLDEIKENKRLNRLSKVKKLVREGDWPIRHEVRRELWRELCRGKDFDSSKAVFCDQLMEINRSGKNINNPQFLNEDGVVINNFDLNELGTVKLLRLLKVIENMRPEISSAPMLYPLCALMLHYFDDSDVFACINHLLGSKGFLMTSPVEWAASAHTLLALIKKHKPSSYNLLKGRVGTPDDVVLVKTMRNWLTWIFNGLPLSHVVRVVDCYLVEGNKFIVRAAITIVYIWAKGLKSGSHNDDLSGKSLDERVAIIRSEIQNIAQQMQISTETFISTCTRIRNLQSANIARIQLHYEDRLRDEVTRDQTRLKSSRGRSSRHLYSKPFESKVIDSEAAAEIMSFLPPRLQLATPLLVYRLSRDGASFTHLWSKIDAADQSILIIKSVKGEIFGAYCSSSWIERNDRRERTKSKYFGTGESFVWRLDEESELPVIYGWVGNSNDNPDACPQMFMAANDRLLVIGSGDGDAIRIDEELTRGMSSACKTFASPALVPSRGFDIDELEVFEVLTGT